MVYILSTVVRHLVRYILKNNCPWSASSWVRSALDWAMFYCICYFYRIIIEQLFPKFPLTLIPMKKQEIEGNNSNVWRFNRGKQYFEGLRIPTTNRNMEQQVFGTNGFDDNCPLYTGNQCRDFEPCHAGFLSCGKQTLTILMLPLHCNAAFMPVFSH